MHNNNNLLIFYVIYYWSISFIGDHEPFFDYFFLHFLVLYFTLATTYHFLSPKYDNYVCLMSISILLISYHSLQLGTTSMVNLISYLIGCASEQGMTSFTRLQIGEIPMKIGIHN